MELNDRRRNILAAVIHRYITTAEPVSSSEIVEKYNLKLSSATIRHEMNLLEKEEYLWQPHTSAGRVPTDKGYRFYVDNLMKRSSLRDIEKEEIVEIYQKSKGFEEMMKITAQLLSKLTNNIGVVLEPHIVNHYIKSIQFIQLENNFILILMITDTGLVFKKLLRLSGEINKRNLDYLSNFINDKLRLNKVNLNHLYEILKVELQKILLFQERFNYIQKFIEECFSLRYFNDRVYLNGRVNLMKQPEFKETDKLNHLLSFIEKENILANTIRQYLTFENTRIIIGSENKQKEMQNCSLITRKYKIKGKTAGAIGILGPTRMNYPRMVSIVEYISEKLSEILSEL